MNNLPADQFADLIEKPVFVPMEKLAEFPDADDPLSILLRKESNGEFLFSEDTGYYANLY